ncbi:MAG: undecaprenyl-diphosphate phosphatase [Flavobacteriales bacterium]|nr:undecaprenyl-diphosphate phosphatase [Flavobacteriales bacterium]MBL0035204.1 undecaprenyl-diphosphate phosphatase [Flavobacteriales bacterium]
MTILQAILIAIIEGLTEFLPVSSTGHMIIGSTLMGIAADDFVKLFTVAIQFGAILSVVVLYWRRFFETLTVYPLLVVGFIPAAIMGLTFKSQIDLLLENVGVVAVALLLGGIFFLFIDKLFPHDGKDRDRPITWLDALVIGCFQVIAMIPGVSRSAATIIGGLTRKLSRKQAAEFSFLLAVPTMAAATAKSMWDYIDDGGTFTPEHWKLFAVGNVVAFIVALLAIKGFVGFLTKHGFALFGWYRIAVGALLLVLLAMGTNLSMV